MKRPVLPRAHARRGAVIVITAVTIVVLLLFASLAVDLGFVNAVCGDMQHSADGAALAGASALYEANESMLADANLAKDRAAEVLAAQAHQVLAFGEGEDPVAAAPSLLLFQDHGLAAAPRRDHHVAGSQRVEAVAAPFA